MKKKLFVAPFLSGSSGPTIDFSAGGGEIVIQSVLVDTLVVELPEGTEVIANEFGEILEELEPEIAETTELEIE